MQMFQYGKHTLHCVLGSVSRNSHNWMFPTSWIICFDSGLKGLNVWFCRRSCLRACRFGWFSCSLRISTVLILSSCSSSCCQAYFPLTVRPMMSVGTDSEDSLWFSRNELLLHLLDAHVVHDEEDTLLSVKRENSSVESILSLGGVHRLSTNFRCWRKEKRCARK